MRSAEVGNKLRNPRYETVGYKVPVNCNKWVRSGVGSIVDGRDTKFKVYLHLTGPKALFKIGTPHRRVRKLEKGGARK